MCNLFKVNKKDTGTTFVSFLNFGKYCWLGLAGKIMKRTKTDANYAILTKQVKLQHEKKPVSNLKCMHSVAFEQTFMKFIEIFVLQEFLYRKKNRSGNHLSDHH